MVAMEAETRVMEMQAKEHWQKWKEQEKCYGF